MATFQNEYFDKKMNEVSKSGQMYQQYIQSFFSEDLTSDEIKNIGNDIETRKNLSSERERLQVNIDMTTGRMVGIYKANGEVEKRSGSYNVYNFDTSSSYTESIDKTLNKNLIGMAYISDHQLDLDTGIDEAVISSFIASGLSAALASKLPSGIVSDLVKAHTKLRGLDNLTRAKVNQYWGDVAANGINSTAGLAIEDAYADDLSQASADIVALCRDIDYSGLTDNEKNKIDAINKFALILTAFIPAGPILTLGISGLLAGIQSWLKHSESVALGGIEINHFFNNVSENGIAKDEYLFPDRGDPINAELKYGLDSVLADSKDHNIIEGNSEDNFICTVDGGEIIQNELYGKGGEDTLTGYKYKDKLDGGSGDDVLEGRGGNDIDMLP